MDDARIGRALRELRRRRGLTQQQLAELAGVPQSLISEIERGHAAGVRLAVLRQIFGVVDAGFEGTVVWRAGGLDRLLDQRHAALVGARVRRLEALAWEPIVEATYSVYGERGSIDILAGQPAHRAVLVDEVKSELTALEALGRKTDEKERLVRQVLCRQRFGWEPRAVARVLVLPEGGAARRAVERNRTVVRALFPATGREVASWLRNPVGDLAGIVFLPDIAPGVGMRRLPGPQRVRRAR